MQQKCLDQAGDNVLFARYLNKGIQIIDCALDWLDKNEDKLKTKAQENLSKLRWTGKTIDLVEMALAVHESGSINNGEVTVKAVVNFFCDPLGVNPGNFSSLYAIMRARANSRTMFLDKLKRVFENKMDRDGEKVPKKKSIR
ncbi:MAG: RteC domain-containing protein [Prolixibacteraceae bacterium]|nr:RteC domain-containing protein [Prolixibacteraceae bacterium]